MAKIQIALDCQNTEEALEILSEVHDLVDVIEVGTILCLQDGSRAIREISSAYPNREIMADTKCADAGGTVAQNAKNAGANQMTVMCCASIETMIQAKKVMSNLQVELYGDWTFEQALLWQQNDINHVIYHQSRDALLGGKGWSDKDIERVQKLIDYGITVSVTGGLNADSLNQFEGMDIDTFIFGRAIAASTNPREAITGIRKSLEGIGA